MKKKRNYDITHRVMRVRAGDYALLVEISQKADIPMAEALHLIITDRAEQISEISVNQEKQIPAQIPMSIFSSKASVAVRVRPQAVLATNGSKTVALRIKSKGVRHE